MNRLYAPICILLSVLLMLCPAFSYSASNIPEAANSEDGDTVQITDNNILFYYEANADLPSTMESLARGYSSEYRDANSEFARAEVLKKVIPVIQRKINEARQTDEVCVIISCRIPEYDFERQGFMTTLTRETYIPYNTAGSNYAVCFKNIKHFTFLPLSQDTAAALQGKLEHSRSGSIRILGHISGAEEQIINGSAQKTVFIKISKITIAFQDGSLLGELEAPKPEQKK